LSFFQEKSQFFVEKRRSEITSLLTKNDLDPEIKIQLRMEQLFLSQKDFYLRLKEKILGPLIQDDTQN